MDQDTDNDVLKTYQAYIEENVEPDVTYNRLERMLPFFLKSMPVWMFVFTYFLIKYDWSNLIVALAFAGLYLGFLLYCYFIDYLLKAGGYGAV